MTSTSRRTVSLLATLMLGGFTAPAAVPAANAVGASLWQATVAVPGDFDTVQEAVDAAEPGDLVLISPGVYHEAVDVTTPRLTIRGVDRNEVILDGEFEFDNGIRVLGAGGVAVENLTVRNYTANGVFWTGVDGYRGAYLTSLRNGAYGLYGYDSTNGLIEHSYAAGSSDGGIYIGGCFPCDTVVTDVHSEHNGLGYSGVDSGGNLFIVDSEFNNNRSGMGLATNTYEPCYPHRETTVAGNLVYSNNEGSTAAVDLALLVMGNGIVAGGTVRDTITKNRVWDHDRTGISLVPFPDQALDDETDRDDWDLPCAETRDDPVSTSPPALLLWDAYENVVTGNVVSDNRVADLAVASVDEDVATLGNCFAGNTFDTSLPVDIETLAPCTGEGSGDWTNGKLDVTAWVTEIESLPPGVDYRVVELPERGPFENMTDAATAPAVPASGPPVIDLESIEVPLVPAIGS